MMFNKRTINIIRITHNFITATKLHVEKKKLFLAKEMKYPSKDFQKAFAGIRKDFDIKGAKLLFPDDKFYLLLFDADSLEGGHVYDLAKQQIPEDLNNLYYGWKVVDGMNDTHRVQFYAVSKEYIDSYISAAHANDIKIETIESVSYSLARLTKHGKSPHILIYCTNDNALIVCTFNGTVYASVMEHRVTYLKERVREVIKFAKYRFGITVSRIYLSAVDNTRMSKYLQGLDIKNIELDPVAGLAITEFSNEEALTIYIDALDGERKKRKKEKESKISEKKHVKFNDTAKHKKGHELKKLAVLVLLLASLVATVGYAYRSIKASLSKNVPRKVATETAHEVKTEVEKENKVSPVSELDKVEKKSDEGILDLSVYDINVRNGNGIPGDALKVEALLKNKGFNVVNVENADKYDYDNTKVKVKEGLDEAFQKQLVSSLKENYRSVFVEVVKTGLKYDVVVILGSPK